MSCDSGCSRAVVTALVCCGAQTLAACDSEAAFQAVKDAVCHSFSTMETGEPKPRKRKKKKKSAESAEHEADASMQEDVAAAGLQQDRMPSANLAAHDSNTALIAMWDAALRSEDEIMAAARQAHQAGVAWEDLFQVLLWIIAESPLPSRRSQRETAFADVGTLIRLFVEELGVGINARVMDVSALVVSEGAESFVDLTLLHRALSISKDGQPYSAPAPTIQLLLELGEHIIDDCVDAFSSADVRRGRSQYRKW